MNTSPRILIVEDDAVLVVDLRNMLTQMGYQVIGMAATGKAAVELAFTQKPDAILMDINLRGNMNGIQAAEQIHVQQDIPVIYLTAYTDETLLQQAKTTDAYAYLAKPVRERELHASLEMALYKHSAEQRLQHLNQVLRAVRDVNQLITREHDPQHLMDEACKILLRTRGYLHVWIGQSAQNILSPRAFAGDGKELIEKIVATATPAHGQRLPGVQAASTRQVIICADMQHDERYQPWREDVERIHFQSTVAVPILYENNLFGVLIVYADQTDFFNEEEVDLLMELAGDIAFGLKAIDEDRQKKQAEESLRENERFIRSTLNALTAHIAVLDETGTIISVNEAWADFARANNGDSSKTGVGINYLAICDSASGTDSEEAKETGAGIRAVMSGERVSFELEYPCDSLDEQRWFTERVSRFEDGGPVRVVIAHYDITERKRAEEESALKNKQLTTLNQLGQVLNNLAPLPEIMAHISDLIGQVFDNRNLYIALYDEATNFVSFPIYWMAGEKRNSLEGRPLSNGLTEFVIRARAPILISDHVEEALAERGVARIGTVCQCYLGVPIMIDERVIGVIAVQDYERSLVYNANHIELLTTIASQAAIAIENARLYETIQQELTERKRAEETLQRQNQFLIALQNTTVELVSQLELKTLLENIVKRACALVRTSAGLLDLVDPATNQLMPQIGMGALKESLHLPVQPGEGLVGIVWQTGKMLVIPDYDQWAGRLDKFSHSTLGSVIGVPLLSGGHVLGVLATGSAYGVAYHFDPAAIEIMHQFARLATVAVQNARLFSNLQIELGERKHAEERLQQSEKKYRDLFQVNKDGISIFILSPGGLPRTFVELNEAAHNMLGYTREEMLQLTPEDLEPKVTMAQLQSRQSELMSKGVANFETILAHKDGHLVYVEFTSQLIQYEGQPAVMNIVRDISERKRAEEILQASEQAAVRIAEQLQMVHQMSLSLTTGLDMERLLQTLYEQCQRIGDTDAFYVALYNDATGVLTSPFNYKDGERRPFIPRKIRENAGMVGRIIESRQTLYLPDMQTAPPSLTVIREPGIPTRSYVGIPLILNERVVGVLSVQSHKPDAYSSEQISTLELLATEVAIAIQNSQLYEQVQREKNLADALIENLPGAFCLIDQQTRMIRWNNFAETQLDYLRDEVQYMNVLNLIDPADRMRIAGLIPQSFEAGQVNTETQLVSKHGDHKIPVYINSTRVQFGSRIYLLTIGIDISERKQREHELQAIASLSAALRTAPTRAEMLPVIIQQMVDLLNCDSVTIEIIDPQTGDAVVESAHGSWEPLVGVRQAQGTGINAIITETLQPYHTHDLEHAPNLTYPAWARDGIRGGVGVPLIAQEKLIGFIWGGRKTDIAETEVRLLAAIADMAANAIHRSTLHEQTQKNAADLELAYNTTLEGWAHALELRDQETEGHSQRVVQKTLELARMMGVSEDELEDIRRGALLHDIGKMGIPDSILLKAGALDEGEWEVMRRHPEYAFNLLDRIEYLRPALDIPYCHHEKWDGSGYPRKLKGEEIPFPARIFAIVDVWDALTNDRPYRPAWSVEKTAEYIRQQSEKHFDPRVVEVFLNSLQSIA